MSDRDTITLPRELAEKALEALEHFKLVFGGYSEEVKALRTALAAPRLEVTVDPRLTAEEAAAISAALAAEQPRHPGYVIGNHWFETAYERLCAGEAEDAILEDYEVVREPRLRDLRRDAERYQWLRERAWFQFEFEGRYGDSGETVQELDAAIDAAMGDKR